MGHQLAFMDDLRSIMSATTRDNPRSQLFGDLATIGLRERHDLASRLVHELLEDTELAPWPGPKLLSASTRKIVIDIKDQGLEVIEGLLLVIA